MISPDISDVAGIKPKPIIKPDQAVQWRPYQRQATNAAVVALKAGKAALLVLPTGSGKSLNAAEAAHRAHVARLRTLIIAPSRELVQQDADALSLVTGNTVKPSLACAGLGPVELDGAIVIGTPQTLVRRLEQLGRIDLLIVDEAHRLGRKASGQIHTILAQLRARNPALMLCGLTATPFRLDSGRLTEGKDRLFEVVAWKAEYLDLVAEKYLAPLVGPRDAIERLDVAGLRIVGGDYAASDLTRFDRDEITERIAAQIVAHGVDRKSWLVFAVSIKHAEHLAAALAERGVDARLLTGQTPSVERKDLVADFKAGMVKCLVGCDVFSTGFDAPAVDLIAIVRPTCSPVWHVQSAGRGTRPAHGKTDCLILDFAGNFSRLGPIDAPYIRAKGERARSGDDAPLTQGCPHCNAIIAARSKTCPVCDTVLEAEQKPRRTDTLSTRAAGHAIITGLDQVFPVRGVAYLLHHKPGRPDSVQIKYHVDGFRFRTVSEWLCCWHPGIAGQQARQEWRQRLRQGAPYQIPGDAAEAVAVAAIALLRPPHVRITRRGEFVHAIPLFTEKAIA
jgi:DNA repair protein RadD